MSSYIFLHSLTEKSVREKGIFRELGIRPVHQRSNVFRRLAGGGHEGLLPSHPPALAPAESSIDAFWRDESAAQCHPELTTVMLSVSEASHAMDNEMLRCVQHDKRVLFGMISSGCYIG